MINQKKAKLKKEKIVDDTTPCVNCGMPLERGQEFCPCCGTPNVDYDPEKDNESLI